MKKLLTPLALLALLLASGGCKKDDPAASLPAATQTGANTAGCLINGEAFVAKSYGGNVLSSPIPGLSGGFSFDSLYQLSMRAEQNGQGIEVMIFLRGEKRGTYALNKKTTFYPQGSPQFLFSHATYRVISSSSREVYVTDTHHTGAVTLTKTDIAGGLSAGTFYFTAASNRDSTKTITITNGRFDRKR